MGGFLNGGHFTIFSKCLNSVFGAFFDVFEIFRNFWIRYFGHFLFFLGFFSAVFGFSGIFGTEFTYLEPQKPLGGDFWAKTKFWNMRYFYPPSRKTHRRFSEILQDLRFKYLKSADGGFSRWGVKSHNFLIFVLAQNSPPRVRWAWNRAGPAQNNPRIPNPGSKIPQNPKNLKFSKFKSLKTS